MRSLAHAFFLAMSDYWHERLLSACSILGLAAALAPLMVLLGVRNGIITAMTERLLNDPRTLEITPVGSGRYGPDWFQMTGSLPGVAFVVPQTRSIAATMNLSGIHSEQDASPLFGNGLSQTVLSLTATAPGDPLLLRWKQPDAGWETLPSPSGEMPDENGEDANPVPAKNVAAVILSASAAGKLGAVPGSLLSGRVDRVRAGKREAASLLLRVVSVLPAGAQGTDMMYVPLELLVATEDYRDGKAVPFLGWTGETAGRSLPSHGEKTTVAAVKGYADELRATREFASFRLYAKTLDDVAPLWRWLQNHAVEVYVKADEIETVQNLDRAFGLVFSLITGAAVFGFTASTASNALAGVRRKSRSIGIMRLMGFRRAGILLFPLAQTVATGFFGSVLASFLYLGVAVSIDKLFSSSLPGRETVCSLPASFLAAIFGVVLLLSALSALFAAWQAAAIEASEVIRDV